MLAYSTVLAKAGVQSLVASSKAFFRESEFLILEFGDRDIKDAQRSYTFPIIHIETEDDDCKKIAKNEDGSVRFIFRESEFLILRMMTLTFLAASLASCCFPLPGLYL